MIEDITSRHPDYGRITNALNRDQCPDCAAFGFRPGPRGGASQNIFCRGCGSGFNVGPVLPGLPREIVFVQRIGKP
jgi:hypothetical protein